MLELPLLIKNIGQIVTLKPLATAKRTTRIEKKDLGVYQQAWLWVDAQGRVVDIGQGTVPLSATKEARIIDANGALVLPGFVDSHTHLIWAGSRASEMERRLNGETYQQIAQSGGGIRSTVEATRAASDEKLLQLCLVRAKRFLSLGTTTLEVKSGYGLSIEHELRLLRILKKLEGQIPQTLYKTCLALHAASPEHPTLGSWVKQCTQELLPALIREGLADAVDAFIEQGYFSVQDVEPFMQEAARHGLKIRLHADEFSDAGAALAASAWHAQSADHLQFAANDAPLAMAQAGVTATLLPGTSLYTKLPFTSGRKFADADVSVAIASDFNPGSCMIDNLPMLATVACIHAGLTPAEALAGITYVPAVSLGFGAQKGALAPGYDADFLMYSNICSAVDWLADFGRSLPSQVWIRGKQCL